VVNFQAGHEVFRAEQTAIADEFPGGGTGGGGTEGGPAWVHPKWEDYEFGRYAWILDAARNRIELWEPARHS
jgi:hypothetical protein